MAALLRCVSYFSFLTGLLSPRDLVDCAVRQEIGHLGLCDWGGLYGHPVFAQEAARAGIHAVFGVELGEGRERLVLLARDQGGYRRLCRLVSGYRLEQGTVRELLEREAEERSAREELFVLAQEADLLRFAVERLGREAVRVPVPPLYPFDALERAQAAAEEGRGEEAQRPTREELRRWYACDDSAFNHPVCNAPTRDGLTRNALTRNAPTRNAPTRNAPTREGSSGAGSAHADSAGGVDEDPARRKCPAPESPRSRQQMLASVEFLGVRGVAAPWVYYGVPEQRALHRLAVAIKLGRHHMRVEREELAPKGSFLPSAQELREAYADAPELLQESERLARSCTLSLLEPRPLLFPRWTAGEGTAGEGTAGERAEPEQRARAELRMRAESGFLQRYGRSPESDARQRLEHELAVISGLGFAGYFLVVDEIVGIAREREIPLLGRGSAADSLVAYCLGFTEADPLRYELCFERFLSVERFRERMAQAQKLRNGMRQGAQGAQGVQGAQGAQGVQGASGPSFARGGANVLPDIDLDFCWRRRDELIEAVIQHFGEGQVALLATQPSLGFRAAYREVARAFGYSRLELDRCARLLPRQIPESMLIQGRSGDLSVLEALFDRAPELRRRRQRLVGGLEERRRELALLRGAFGLTGAKRYLGLHPGGTVLSPDALASYAPLERSAKGLPVVQWDKHVAPHMGLVKIDLLGNRGLSVFSDAQRELRRIGGSLPEPLQAKVGEGAREDALERDERSAAMLREGRTLGCWQLESPGMRALLTRMQAERQQDVIQSIALIRPGPAASGMMDSFVRRARGIEALPELPPELAFLHQSRGVLLYQEDVIRCLARICDISLGQAEVLRRKLGERSSVRGGARPAAAAVRRFYQERCAARGIDPRLAQSTWEQIERFAAFSFCKAHSVSYGLLAWRIAVLMAHRPATVIAALLANGTGYYDKRVYVDEAKRRGISVLPPCVHRSDLSFCAERLGRAGPAPGGPAPCGGVRAALRTGLGELRELPQQAAAAIVREREEGGPFFSIEVFVQRLRQRGVVLAESMVERLILLGAFDMLEGTRPEKLWRYRLGARHREEARERLARGEAELGLDGSIETRGLFPDALLPRAPVIPCLPEFDEEERGRFEMAWLGFTTAMHPMRLHGAWQERQRPGATELGDVTEVQRQAALPLSEAPSHLGREVQICAWLAAMRRHRVRPSGSRAGGWMCFLSFEDETGMLEVVLFPDRYRRFGGELAGEGLYQVRGRIEQREGAIALHAEALEALH
ncbi:MAG: hypothetical protein CSA62_00960 [Planctomycetota bacterium]|nr:MAG: hypothetical protein CSA62_00960 [Planctomycetota bacterium]